MRTHGTLTKWNDDRGFGFITPAGDSDELFVHISAFPRDNQRPRLNEVISFVVEEGSDGKRRATSVMRPGSHATTRKAVNKSPSKSRNGLSGVVLGLLAFAAIGTYGYSRFSDPETIPASEPSASHASVSTVDTSRCDGRTMCSQMRSCAEAKYFIRHCPNTKMDGNNDGEPCEQQWCNEFLGDF